MQFAIANLPNNWNFHLILGHFCASSYRSAQNLQTPTAL